MVCEAPRVPLPMPSPIRPRCDSRMLLTIERVENGQVVTLGENGPRHVFSDPNAGRILEFIHQWLAGLDPKS